MAARRDSGNHGDGTDFSGDDHRCLTHDRQLDDHEQRLRALETARWKMAGAIGSLAGLASFGGAIAAKLLLP